MYSIIEEKCTGCGRCFKSCPRDAITMINKKAQIDPDKCNNCGMCVEACKDDAIVIVNKTLQKSEASFQDVAETSEPEVPRIRLSSKSGLLVGAFGLLLDGARYLLQSYVNKSAHSNLPAASPPYMQNRSMGKRQRQRMRRGHLGRRGGRF